MAPSRATVVEGYTFIDHFSWDAYNESIDLKQYIQEDDERFCYAYKIYMNRENRAFLKEYHIKADGKPGGDPPKRRRQKSTRLKQSKIRVEPYL